MRYSVEVIGPEGTWYKELPSVTEIVDKVMAKRGLHDWYYKQGVVGFSQLLDLYGDMLPHDVPSLHSLMSTKGLSPYAQRDALQKIGSKVHHAMASLGVGKRHRGDQAIFDTYPELESWWGEGERTVLAVEQTLLSMRYGFAGTCDLVYEQYGLNTMADYKTGSMYDSHIIQVELYRWAYEEMGLGHIDRLNIIQLPRDGSPVKENIIQLSDDLTTAAEGVLYLYQWNGGKKRRGK